MEVYIEEEKVNIELGDLFVDIRRDNYMFASVGENKYALVNLNAGDVWEGYVWNSLEHAESVLQINVDEQVIKHYSLDKYDMNLRVKRVGV